MQLARCHDSPHIGIQDIVIGDLRAASNLTLARAEIFLRRQGELTDDINDVIESHGYVVTGDGLVVDVDDTKFCVISEEHYHEDDMRQVVTKITNSGHVCETVWMHTDEADSRAFYCHESEELYHSSYFSESTREGGDSVCDEYMGCGRSGYMWSERCDCWVHESDWVTGEHDWESDEPHSDYMADYHGSYRPWGKKIDKAQRSLELHFGYELEMYFPSFDDREDFMRDVRRTWRDAHVVFERDGSLDDDEAGVEAITVPLTMAEVRNGSGLLNELLLCAQEHDAYVEDDCGTHITVNMHSLLRPAREDVYRLFYAAAPLSAFISRRNTDNNAGTSYASYRNPYENSKYTAVNRRDDDLFEFRAFAGTVEPKRAASYAEYIAALIAWVKEHPQMDPGRLSVSQFNPAFRAYVNSRADLYPNLALALRGKQLKGVA